MTYRVAPVAIGTTEHNRAALGPAKVPRANRANRPLESPGRLLHVLNAAESYVGYYVDPTPHPDPQ